MLAPCFPETSSETRCFCAITTVIRERETLLLASAVTASLLKDVDHYLARPYSVGSSVQFGDRRDFGDSRCIGASTNSDARRSIHSSYLHWTQDRASDKRSPPALPANPREQVPIQTKHMVRKCQSIKTPAGGSLRTTAVGHNGSRPQRHRLLCTQPTNPIHGSRNPDAGRSFQHSPHSARLPF
jgi:hypothetical protein